MISCIDETVSIGSDPSLPARKGPRKEPDKQAAYLHAAAQAVYERTVERLAPTNAPAAKAD